MAEQNLREALGKFPPSYFAKELDRDIAKFGSVAGIRKASLNGPAFCAVELDASDEAIAAELVRAICRDRPLIVKVNGQWRSVKLESWDGCFD
jgi:hypothetical protein